MKPNDVTLFSNGIGHFRRYFQIRSGEPEVVRIPFNRHHIGDVAASLQVFGQVRLNTPPSFTPTNANATALKIDPKHSYMSLLSSMSGSEVSYQLMNNTMRGKGILLGVESEQLVNADGIGEDRYVVMMTDSGVSRYAFRDIKSLKFEQESVQTEIDKALKNNFQSIKPDSTLMELSLSPLTGAEQEAYIQYTVPVAAWKMRYSIREYKGKFSLEGSAIIDNNTDEDWDNFRVSVVTGNPISFSTDLAQVSVPQRKFIKLVEDYALSNVNVEDGMPVMAAACVMDPNSFNPTRGSRSRNKGISSKMSVSNYSNVGLENHRGNDAEYSDEYEMVGMAETPGVDSREIGDFCVFTSKEPIAILAKKSAIVPMFTVPLTKAGVVLLYNERNHARRPYRAIKFKNESEYSLGKGKTSIYNEDLFSGECVLEATKPGENRMLPHCLENGVKITKEVKPVESKRQSLKFSDGVVFMEDNSTAVVTYTLENKKDEPFKIALEHQCVLHFESAKVSFEGQEFKDIEKLVNERAYRVYCELKPKEKLTITVKELVVNSHQFRLGDNCQWLTANVVNVGIPLANDKNIKTCLAIQQQIDELNTKVMEAKEQRDELVEQVERVRKNLVAAKDLSSHNETVARWVNDLEVSESEIRKIDKTTVPNLMNSIKEQRQKLSEEFKKISGAWLA